MYVHARAHSCAIRSTFVDLQPWAHICDGTTLLSVTLGGHVIAFRPYNTLTGRHPTFRCCSLPASITHRVRVGVAANRYICICMRYSSFILD
jgi:hypothetical protein